MVDRDAVAARVADARRGDLFASPYHAGACSLTRDCGPHCGTRSPAEAATGADARTSHCPCDQCNCPAGQVVEAEILEPAGRPMCWGARQ
jgi:hypothetical protein